MAASASHHTAGEEEVFTAVESGDLERVQELLQDTGPAIRRQNTNCTLLHTAASYCQLDIVLFLLKLISPNIVNKDGQTPAHLAAVRGHTQLLRILLSDEEMNHDKRDNCHRTYKDLLSVPLYELVLRDIQTKVQELLKLGADPDYSVESLVDTVLEHKVTTPRQLALVLHREAILSLFPKERRVEKRTTTTTTDLSVLHSSDDVYHITSDHESLKSRVKPSSVQATGPDVYKMNTDPRGYVCILSYCSFKDRPDLDLEGSRSDVNNLASVFGKMGYTGHAHFSLTAAQTKQVLTKVRDMEVLDHVGCAVFIISSHGIGNEKFLTNDMKRLATEWVCDLFKDSECPRLKNKPKLFIFDFCCGYYQNESPRQVSTARSTRVREPLQDMMCLYSSSGDFTSYTYTKEGTPFITALCRTLVQQAHDKELCDWYREFLKEYNKLSPTSAPQLCNFGFTKKFYFNPKC
ncbi:uncharacterized protein LOC121855528 [Homarus americanus]|uniref:uncharacterized protein LOC121855528 n=1 Tax=Homarus americanus TaxID=6706 RepID=UPI001C482172|nr:uncharacterized protein LOC121855528 [Homarus americanus]